MLFVSVQAVPQRRVGSIYEPCNFSKDDTPLNKSLGFKPMWAVPITTFKDTVVSLFLTANNCPQLLVIVECDNYVRIDKIKHYQNIRDDVYRINDISFQKYPIADIDTPDYLVEYALDRTKIKVIYMGLTIDVLRVSNGDITFDETISYEDKVTLKSSDNLNNMIGDIISESVDKMFELQASIPILKRQWMADSMSETMLILSHKSWMAYRFLYLPLILSIFIDGNVDKLLPGHTCSFKYFKLYSMMASHRSLLSVSNDMARWSYDSCDKDEYIRLYNRCKDMIIESDEVLEALLTLNKPGRNDICPCGSQRKFKKCCGKYID